jgi:exonuclease SbcC
MAFAKGPNILIGHMGAGKSSVMDAISFGLFGTFPARQNRRVDNENIIRNSKEKNRSAKVKLSFGIEGVNYVVEREITSGGQSKATLQKNGVYTQSQPQRVTEEIEKALAMDYDLFSRAVYSEQNRLDYFLELKASDRKKQIDNLLGLDRFAAAQENNTSLINRIRDMAEEGERVVKGFEVDRQNEELEKMIEEEKVDSEKLEETRKELVALNAEKTVLGDRLEKMRADLSKKNLTVRKIAEMQSRIDLLSEEILKIEAQNPGSVDDLTLALSKEEKELNRLKEDLGKVTKTAREQQNLLGKLQNESATIEKDAAKKVKYEDELRSSGRERISGELIKLKKELEGIEERIAQNVSIRKESEKWIRELQEEKGKCPVCERDLNEIMRKELLKTKNDTLQKALKEYDVLLSSKKKLKEGYDNLEIKIKRIGVIEDSLKLYTDIEKRKKENKEKLAMIKAETEESAARIKSLDLEVVKTNEKISSMKSAYASAERRDKYIKEKKAGEESIKELNGTLANLEVNEKAIDELQKRITLMNSETGRREAMAEALTVRVADKNKEILSRKKEIERISKIKKDVEYKRLVSENLTKFGNSLLETQALLRSRLIGSVNRIMEEIWPELYPYGDYVGIKLEGSETDYTLKLCLQRDEGEVWEDVEAIASGGERNIACLAMRIAFAMVLVPNLKWLILDEPTHNIDRRGIGKLVEVFNEKLPKIVDQVFIITHEEEMKQISGGRVFVLGRDKANNEATNVSES